MKKVFIVMEHLITGGFAFYEVYATREAAEKRVAEEKRVNIYTRIRVYKKEVIN